LVYDHKDRSKRPSRQRERSTREKQQLSRLSHAKKTKKLIVKHVYSHQPSISQPDWDTEQFSLRHLSWWHARFEVDREERVGCPLAPDLAVLISEGPIQNIDEEENTE